MSRTILHQQCRTLPRFLDSTINLHNKRITQVCPTFPARRSCLSKRLVHTARAHSHHGRSTGPSSEEDTKHDILKTKELKDDLRLLLRDIAQPVAVVTSFMPTNGSASVGPGLYAGRSTSSTISNTTSHSIPDASEISGNDAKYHGATLSSFTSIAMDPYPLVAFALRIPSRMATTLSSLAPSLPSSSPKNPMSHLSSHMVINLLSASQASAAITFSRPDLYPAPFVDGAESSKHKYTLNKDGLPILHGVVGALSCRLVSGPIPLHDLDYFGSGFGSKAKELKLGSGGVASELFIARVMRVENVRSLRDDSNTEDEEDWERTFPLVYHRRNYTSCHPRPGRTNDKKN